MAMFPDQLRVVYMLRMLGKCYYCDNLHVCSSNFMVLWTCAIVSLHCVGIITYILILISLMVKVSLWRTYVHIHVEKYP